MKKQEEEFKEKHPLVFEISIRQKSNKTFIVNYRKSGGFFIKEEAETLAQAYTKLVSRAINELTIDVIKLGEKAIKK